MSVHCGTKVKHATRDEALAHVKALVAHNHATGQSDRSIGLAPYACDECGSWHVGHHPTAPLVYHYTCVVYLEDIERSGKLKPTKARAITVSEKLVKVSPKRSAIRRVVLPEPEPLLWFSSNLVWEASVSKIDDRAVLRDNGARIQPGRASNECLGGGLLRFGVPATLAKLRWADYLQRNPCPPWERHHMEQIGDPREWFATDEPVPMDRVRTIEVFYRGSWIDMASTPDDFEDYLTERGAEYEGAWKTLLEKARASGGEGSLALTPTERILWDDARMWGGYGRSARRVSERRARRARRRARAGRYRKRVSNRPDWPRPVAIVLGGHLTPSPELDRLARARAGPGFRASATIRLHPRGHHAGSSLREEIDRPGRSR